MHTRIFNPEGVRCNLHQYLTCEMANRAAVKPLARYNVGNDVYVEL